MRILHTSDWHLGRILHEHSLLPDQDRFLRDLLEHLRRSPCDALILAGDVFDRSIPSEEAVALWNSFLEGLASTGTSLLAVPGNHDSATRVSLASRLIERSGIHIRGGVDRLEEPVELTDADGARAHIWLVPFLWAGDLVHDGEAGPVVLQTQEAALEEAVARIRRRLDPARINVLVAHCFAAGGQVSDSERTLVGAAVQVDPGLFEGFDYVALGHLHRPQGLGPRVRYSGSPLAYSFSEAGQGKSMAAVTLAKGATPVVERVPVAPLRPMVELRGTLEDLLEDPRFAGLDDAYVRVCLARPAGLAQPVARLRGRFPLLLDFQDFTTEPVEPQSTLEALQRPDLLQEFQAFERRLRGDAGAPEGLLAAFSALRDQMERAR